MRRARVILGLFGTLAALALALWLIDWQMLLAAFVHLSPGTLLVSAVLSVASTLLQAVRWAVLMARPGDRIGTQEFHDALVGQAFNLITPAALGADAYRVVMAGGREGGLTPAMAMVVLERLLGFAAYAAAFLLAFASGVDDLASEAMSGAATFFASTLVALAVLFIAARYPVWHGLRLPNAFALAREPIRRVATLPPWRSWCALALTLAGLGTWLLCVGIIAIASGVSLPVHVIVAIAVVTECARLLPISIQGIGVREATFAALAIQAGGVGAAAFAACATAYALHFVMSGLLGIVARTSFDYKKLRRPS
jgi:glycosyltransferase 2 family protein